VRVFVCVIGIVLGVVSVRAETPDCTPQKMEYLAIGEPGVGQVPNPYNPVLVNHGWVPDNEVWQIRAAGIGSTLSAPAEYMLEIQHKVFSYGNVCCWFIPAMRATGAPDGTPTLALDRTLVLHAGERLGARVNGITASAFISLFYVGWKFPADCTAALVVPLPQQ
jgi:hypothetical protein